MRLFLCRHGETEWTLSGQHTSFTDIHLTENGKKQAKLLGKRLQQNTFIKIFSSPRSRAIETCKLCGLIPTIDPDLQEWNYGSFEGKTSEEIERTHPHWNVFINGPDGGESIPEITSRADRFLLKLKSYSGDVAIFSHGHFSRVLAARWLQLPASFGKSLSLATASLSILSYERAFPAIQLWNDTSHLHDLDHLSGTWSSKDGKTFKKNTKAFEQIDKDLWS